MSIRIKVKREVLTDKSEVFNVVLCQEGSNEDITMAAYNEKDADALVEALRDAIDVYTVEQVWT